MRKRSLCTQAEKRRVLHDPVTCMNKGGHPNGYPPLLNTDYNFDTTAAASALERNETAFYLHNTAEVVERAFGSYNKTRQTFKESLK